MTEKKKAALYARVSTRDKDQHPETQLEPLREYCKQKGLSIYKEYKDYESGRNSEREALAQLKKDVVKTREIGAVFVWKMDRLSRGGIRDTFNQIDYFKRYKIPVISLTEPFLSTDNPSAELILAVLSWSAEQESKDIGLRVKAGIARYKGEGGRWGRKSEIDVKEVKNLRKKMWSYRKIAKKLGFSVSSIYEALNRRSENPQKSSRRKKV